MKLFKTKKSERGQALAEYHVLIPGSILLTGFMLPTLGRGLNNAYCDIVGMFRPDVCEVSVEEEAPPPEDEQCVVHEMTSGGSQCDQSEDCSLLDVGINHGTFEAPQGSVIQSFVIKAGQDYFIYQSGLTEDGCYNVDLATDGSMVTWDRVGEGSDCKDVSHLESWYVELCVYE